MHNPDRAASRTAQPHHAAPAMQTRRTTASPRDGDRDVNACQALSLACWLAINGQFDDRGPHESNSQNVNSLSTRSLRVKDAARSLARLRISPAGQPPQRIQDLVQFVIRRVRHLDEVVRVDAHDLFQVMTAVGIIVKKIAIRPVLVSKNPIGKTVDQQHALAKIVARGVRQVVVIDRFAEGIQHLRIAFSSKSDSSKGLSA